MTTSKESADRRAALSEAQRAFSQTKKLGIFHRERKWSDGVIRSIGILVAVTGMTLIFILLRSSPHTVHVRPTGLRGLFFLPLYTVYGMLLGVFGRRVIDRTAESRTLGWSLAGILVAISTAFYFWYLSRYAAE